VVTRTVPDPGSLIDVRERRPVPEPKDVRGLAACDLLTDDGLRESGLRPETAEPVDAQMLLRGCTWRALPPAGPVFVLVSDAAERSAFDALYPLRASTGALAEVAVVGHPAVRFDLPDTGCTIVTATAEGQAVTVEVDAAGRGRPGPCELARGLSEAIVSRLPPLVE
jgi:hypothetical protein